MVPIFVREPKTDVMFTSSLTCSINSSLCCMGLSPIMGLSGRSKKQGVQE